MNENDEGGFINPIKSIKNTYNKAKKFITSGSERFTSKVESILQKVGNEQINSIVICRHPIPSMIQKALEIVSLKELEYDKLFHLFVLINGHILLEKNSVINMQINPKLNGDMEHMTAPDPPNTTINQFIERCLHQMGPQKFFSYSAYDNNCQNFQLHLLSANHILNPDLENFIKQNTESIFASNPTLRKLANNITDIDGRAHEIMGGEITDENSNPVSYKTYKMFAKRYKIKLSKNGKLKTMKQLAKEIYDYEKNHDNIDDGLYFHIPIKGGALTDLQKECVRNLTLEQLLSLIDHETGQIIDYGFRPETNEFIYERIRQLTRPTQAPRQTTRKRMN